LYSRQRYALGESAMAKLQHAKVFIGGCDGYSAEIAKNIALLGVEVLTLHSEPSDINDGFDDSVDGSVHIAYERGITAPTKIEATVSYIAKLNPHVSVHPSPSSFSLSGDNEALESVLKDYTCVVLVNTLWDVTKRVNAFCRSHNIAFIWTAVYGVCGTVFSDFGDHFISNDLDGETRKEVQLKERKGSRPVVCTCFDKERHGLDTGDFVYFEDFNNTSSSSSKDAHKVTVRDPYTFEVDADGPAEPVVPGGTAVQVKQPVEMHFLSFEESIEKPAFVITGFTPADDPALIHNSLKALQRFASAHGGKLPRSWDKADAEEMASYVEGGQEFKQFAKLFAVMCSLGRFQPMCAFLGGVVGHEVMKAVASQYTPINQWLHVNMADVCSVNLAGEVLSSEAIEDHTPRSTVGEAWLNAQAVCIGWKALDRLAHMKTFVVGAGAIGCELLKNFALLGVATASDGCLTVTDPDLIERSNLNRQFLFREDDIRKPKSETAAKAVKKLCPAMQIRAATEKVCPATEDVFGNVFFGGLDVAVNALDNVAARRYVDECCVLAGKPLLDSGTLGSKGHVQVIVPHLTENYGATNDPAENDVPFCTIHSFPSHMDHCIQWARDVFARSFSNKPSDVHQALTDPHWIDSLRKEGAQASFDKARNVLRLLQTYPKSFDDCIKKAQRLFCRLFNTRIQELLAQYPPDAKNDDGSLVWAPPRRMPSTIVFTEDNSISVAFVQAAAMIFADVYGIPVPNPLPSMGEAQVVPPKKGSAAAAGGAEDDTEKLFADMVSKLEAIIPTVKAAGRHVNPAVFEKDCDANHHIDFIWAAANCRATNYGLGSSERLAVKRVAGKIIPALATTTSAVSGLVSCELVKVLNKMPLSAYKNAFMNLALSLLCFSEPLPPNKEKVADGVYFTVWDNWDVRKPSSSTQYTMQDFVDAAEKKVGKGFSVSTINQGSRCVYMSFNPGHMKRLSESFDSFLQLPTDGTKFVDLVVTFTKDEDDSDVEVPTIKYYFA